ncbi:hypothetical protein EG68_04296 [Paragonimus skrjabini miyazakii]|uniref:SCP domain-containing protein n=1 Tax=Paragonimus skrjabini miyazakii TaxID=59628 RepID=A0A8S9Z1G9_9TREM|nr:hypothetical protein EG68_04296 [Paragonimus skrjabini miyazakii]
MVDTLLNNEAISVHNKLRELHGCPPLVYDSSLARSAQLWAEQLARTKCMRHSEQETYGENLAYKGSLNKATLSGEEATRIWYDQRIMHDFNGEFTYETGYFTQLVWKDTKIVGFGRSSSVDGQAVYVVAHYAPKGNVKNKFALNVPNTSRSSAIIFEQPRGRISQTLDRPLSLSKKDLKERERNEKKERERIEKERKETEKRLKKEQKEREKIEKKERRKSGKF